MGLVNVRKDHCRQQVGGNPSMGSLSVRKDHCRQQVGGNPQYRVSQCKEGPLQAAGWW